MTSALSSQPLVVSCYVGEKEKVNMDLKRCRKRPFRTDRVMLEYPPHSDHGPRYLSKWPVRTDRVMLEYPPHSEHGPRYLSKWPFRASRVMLEYPPHSDHGPRHLSKWLFRTNRVMLEMSVSRGVGGGGRSGEKSEGLSKAYQVCTVDHSTSTYRNKGILAWRVWAGD